MKKLLLCLLFCILFLTSCTLKDCKSTDDSSKTNDDATILDNASTPKDKDVSNNSSNEISKSEKHENNEGANANTSKEVSKVKGKVQLYAEDIFSDEKHFGNNSPKSFCEVVISNVTETSFDFIIYEVTNANTDEKIVIFLNNTATFIDDGTKATFYGKTYTLNFTFPNNHGANPIVTDMKISGFKPLEGKTYCNNKMPVQKYYDTIKNAWQKQKDYIDSIDDPKVKQSVQTTLSAAISESSGLLLKYPEDSDAIDGSLRKVLAGL